MTDYRHSVPFVVFGLSSCRGPSLANFYASLQYGSLAHAHTTSEQLQPLLLRKEWAITRGDGGIASGIQYIHLGIGGSATFAHASSRRGQPTQSSQ